MKKVYLLLFILSSLALQGQDCPPPSAVIEFNPNNISGSLTSSELIFNDFTNDSPGFEAPVGGSVHSIYAANFWIGGITSDSQIKLAGGTYNLNGTDYYNGPLSNGAAEISPEDCSAYDNHFTVCEYESLRHIEYFDCLNDPNCDYISDFPSGYLIPSSFFQYPAHGNTKESQDYYLAPFLDYNSDGSYFPEDGDCPLFTSMLTEADCTSCEALSGHKATFWITNDKGGLHFETAGEPIGVEMHNVVYGFSSTGPLNDVLFHQKKIINRSTIALNDVYVGYWVDFDIGNSTDDFVGCDIERNLAFAYNSDPFDEQSFGSIGYGENPPALGLLLLNGVEQDLPDPVDIKLAGFTSLSNDYGPLGFPEIALDYYNYMRSTNKAGLPHMFPGTDILTEWMAGGDSYLDSENSWTEDNSGEKRTVSSSGPFTFVPGDEQCITNAYIHAQSEDENFSSLEKLKEISDLVQLEYDGCFDCVPPRANIQAVQIEDFAYNFHNIATADNYLWDFGDGTTSTSVAPGHVFSGAGEYNITLTISNECGTHTDTFTVLSEPLSISETLSDAQLIIYPNPAQNQITINSGQLITLDLHITDSSGKLVLFSSINSNTPIDISELANGHYMLKATDRNSAAVFIEQLIILN